MQNAPISILSVFPKVCAKFSQHRAQHFVLERLLPWTVAG